jgi:hypothetical protein
MVGLPPFDVPAGCFQGALLSEAKALLEPGLSLGITRIRPPRTATASPGQSILRGWTPPISPGDSVILSMMTDSTPEGAVLPIEPDPHEGPGRAG